MSEPVKNPRVASLDALRGLTIAIMILVDDVGDKYNDINHSPWDNVTLADFVMPWFLFMVGMSIGISFEKPLKQGKHRDVLSKAAVRCVKLWLLGLALQGGGFPDTDYTYGWNLATIRWCGILQRIAWAFAVVACAEIYLQPSVQPDGGGENFSIMDATSRAGLLNGTTVSEEGSAAMKNRLAFHISIFTDFRYQWLLSALFMILYLVLTFATPVPDYLVSIGKSKGETVLCGGTVGNLSAQCNAAGYYDRFFLQQAHLYMPGEKSRLPVCSCACVASECGPGERDALPVWCNNSNNVCPDKQPRPTWCDTPRPNWCDAPFDPEGLLASIPTVCTCLLGLHFGHTLRRIKDPTERMVHWVPLSLFLIVVGVIIHYAGFPMNKQLWSPSYVAFMAGTSGLCLVFFYFLMDVKKVQAPFMPLVWMGMNAILVFTMAASDVFEVAIGSFYYASLDTPHAKKTNIVDVIQRYIFEYDGEHTAPGLVLAFVLTKISFWFAMSGIFHRYNYYWKI